MTGNATEEFTGGPLFDLYTRYVSEPESRKDVYGYTTLLVGYLVGFAGIATYLLLHPGASGSEVFVVREVSFTAAAIGLVLALLGIVFLLPVQRRGIYMSILGTVLSGAAIAWFVTIYPGNWEVGTPDYSAQIITLYTAGVALVAGVVVMVPILTGERSYFFDARDGAESDAHAIMVGQASRGGLFAVFQQGREWTWRLIDQHAVAAGTSTYLSRLETEDRVERVQQLVNDAGLLEINKAAFRLYQTGEEAWRWLLMREDGSVVADSGEDHPNRAEAEESVSVVKEYGRDASVFVIEEAAFARFREDGEWRWRLVDADRAPLAESGRGYGERGATETGIDRFQSAVGDAGVLVVEHLGVELVHDGDDWRWRLRDADDVALATSAVGFGTRSAAEEAAYDLLEDLPDLGVLSATEPTYEVYETDDGAWTWRLVDDAGRVVARSHDEADSADLAELGATRTRSHVGDADVVELDDETFEVYELGGDWHWRLVTDDREVTARCASPYATREAAEAAVERLRESAPEADLIEFDNAAFQLYESPDGSWRWRLIDEDGNVMADSGDGDYESRDDAASAMMTLQEYATDAEHLEIDSDAFELYQDGDDWGWRLVNQIGDVVAEGGGHHDSRDEAKAAMTDLVDRITEPERRVVEDGIVQVYRDDDQEWRWRLVHPDGTVLADGPDGFATRHAVESAVEDVVPDAASASVGRLGRLGFQVERAGDGWSWRLLDADRETVAEGDVTYDAREDVEVAVMDLKRNAPDATVFEIRDAAFLVAPGDGGWTWRLLTEDHDVLAAGAASYETRGEAREVLQGVAAVAPKASLLDYDDAAYEIREGEAGWTWRLIDESERVIAQGGDDFESRADAEANVDALKSEIGGASILEIETAAFELYEDDEEWRWRLIDETGNALARSLESYPSWGEARQAMTSVKEHAPEAWTSVVE